MRSQQQSPRDTRGSRRVMVSTGARLGIGSATARGEQVVVLVQERRRGAMLHRRSPTEDTRAALAALDQALAAYSIDIPAVEQARRGG